MCFLNGDGVKKNEAEAIRWLNLAAKKGHQEAAVKLREIARSASEPEQTP